MFNVNSKDLPCRQSTPIQFLCLMPSFYKASPASPAPFSGLNFLPAEILTQVRMKTGPQFQKERYICFFHNTHKFPTFITSPASESHTSCIVYPWARSVPTYCRCWDAGSCPHIPANRGSRKPLRKNIYTLQLHQSHFSYVLLPRITDLADLPVTHTGSNISVAD